MDIAQGPSWAWVLLTHHQSAGEQQNGHPRLTSCPMKGQSLLQGEPTERGDGERAGSNPTSHRHQASWSGVAPKAKALRFSIKKQA